MLGPLIRRFSSLAYKHPKIPEKRARNGSFGKLKIALLADYLTAVSLAQECSVALLQPNNYRQILLEWRPDLVFVESAFHGVRDEWRYRLAKQPFYFRLGKDSAIRGIAELAKERNIPACFWNKDDGPFFNAFLDVARLFPFVFTTDQNCLNNYRRKLPGSSKANLLPMAYQPAFHNFTGFNFEIPGACFVGSYYRKFFNKRKQFLDSLFKTASENRVSVHVYDRNSHRFSHFFEFRFPTDIKLHIHPGVSYPETAALFKKYALSINVNSVTSSPTMLSRRLLEILACGGICLTNRTLCVEKEFSDYCIIVDSPDSAAETFLRLAHGPGNIEKEKARAGAEYVRGKHTWNHRLEQLADTLNF